MSIYVDASALLKLYFEEANSEACEEILESDSEWITGRHTSIEVRRNLAKELRSRDLATARDQFRRDWSTMTIVELVESVCEAAAHIAEVTSVATLDSLHLGAAQQLGGGSLPIVTFDLRQAQAARSLGWRVLGA